MDYYKYHGLGNDYIIIDPQKTYIKLNRDNVALICDRHYGLGADGILYGPVYRDDKIHLIIYNSDGSEAEKSGNGLRIFGRYLLDENYIVERQFQVLTKGGPTVISLVDKETWVMSVEMGKITFESENIPVALTPPREVIDERLEINGTALIITCLSIGNPHCVIFNMDANRETATSFGPLIERHSLFPKGINVQFVHVMDRRNIQIEIWERGSGYTLSSGSSSCAAAAAAYKKGLVDASVTVHMPGGTLLTEIDGNSIRLLGPVESIAEGIFTYEMWKRITR